MKKLILLPVFILFLTFFANAQEKPKITVEGISEMKIMPDEALITISLSEKALTTAAVTNELNKKSKAVADALKKSGVTDYTFTADNYYVNINRIYTKGTAKDSGYVASQNLRLVVKNTEKDLIKIVETVQQAADMAFQLSFRVSEEKQKSYQENLLKDALTDARKKASIIAASFELGNLKPYHIDYSSSQPFQPVMYRAEAMMMKSADTRTEPTFNPEEQTVSDRVKVIFTFE
ncbi:SIMPL domain-containing protein [Lunatibacter salilacus]|uniref:SIMPL domain-containing protein n=1 Tax=Lunatibacter salilacus TaxID=2483804 RepID=UPI00131B3DCE|nr:SIMPL domain-containing protein [Lunatibacter salilacus]